MYFYSDACPFIQSPSCGESCLFYCDEKNKCCFLNKQSFISEEHKDIRNSWKYNEALEVHESEFYIWNKDNSSYDIVKWEYRSEFKDF